MIRTKNSLHHPQAAFPGKEWGSREKNAPSAVEEAWVCGDRWLGRGGSPPASLREAGGAGAAAPPLPGRCAAPAFGAAKAGAPQLRKALNTRLCRCAGWRRYAGSPGCSGPYPESPDPRRKRNTGRYPRPFPRPKAAPFAAAGTGPPRNG